MTRSADAMVSARWAMMMMRVIARLRITCSREARNKCGEKGSAERALSGPKVETNAVRGEEISPQDAVYVRSAVRNNTEWRRTQIDGPEPESLERHGSLLSGCA